jgi:hypothetical protein
MWIYFLICAALVAVGSALKHKSPQAGNSLAGIGALVAVGLMVTQFAKEFAGSGKIDRYQGVVGYMMGQNFIRMAPQLSGQVVLIFPPDKASSPEALDTLFNTFARTLLPFSGLEIKDVGLEVDVKTARDGMIPAAVFDTALSQFSNAVAFISFAGAPPAGESLAVWNVAGEGQAPPFLVYDSAGTENWKEPLKEGKIKLVIRPKPGVDRGGEDVAGPPNEIFDKFFEYVRPGD